MSFALCFVSGCAKTGEPQPPLYLVPRPSADLVARQYSDRIVLTVTMPAENTNGTPVASMKRIELFRRADTDRLHGTPLPVREFMQGAERVLSVEQDALSNYLKDKTLIFRDEMSLPDRSSIYRQAFRYAVVFINKKSQSAGLGNQAFIAPVVIPPPPKGLSSQVRQDAIHIQWTAPTENTDGSKPPRIAGYNIYRSDDRQKPSAAPLNSLPLPIPQYEDRGFQFDKTYYYAVSVIGSHENPFAESNASDLLEVAPRDIFPPGMPPRMDVILENATAIILWTAPIDTDVAGYRVYRKEDKTSEREMLVKDLLKNLSYRDASVRQGRSYTYEVTAVDTHGNESRPATASLAVP